MRYDSEVNEIENAYFAGLLDGEGHLGIHRMSKAAGIQYAARVSLRMTEEEVVRQYAECFGVSLHRAVYKNSYSKLPLFVAEVSGRGARSLLEAVAPYLRVKKRQAELLMQLETEKRQPGIRTRKIPTTRLVDGEEIRSTATATGQEYLERWQGLYMQVRELNRPTNQETDS